MSGRRVIRGATVLSLDGRRSLRRGDVLIEDGIIAAVGGVDATGALITEVHGVLMPALVQAHLHVDHCLLDRYFVAEASPRLFQRQVRPWEQALDERATLLQAAAAFSRGLSTGTGVFGDAGGRLGRRRVIEAARHFGVRLSAALDLREAGLLEKELEALQAELDQAPGPPLVRPGLWIGEAESASGTLLRRAGRLSQERGLPLVAHAGGLPGSARLVSRLERAGALHKHLLLIHGSGAALSDPGAVRALARAGAGVVLTPAFDLLMGAPCPPLELMLEAKLNLGLGTESGATRLGGDLFRELKLLHRMLIGRSAEPASAALEIATRGGAAALGLSSGSVAVGQPADLLLLDVEGEPTDGHELVARRIIVQGERSIVRTVWVQGQVVYTDGKVTQSEPPNDQDEEWLRKDLGARCAPAWRHLRSPWVQLLDQFARGARLREGWHQGRAPMLDAPLAAPPAPRGGSGSQPDRSASAARRGG